jgi:8-oxo-dGTP diphosphatase
VPDRDSDICSTLRPQACVGAVAVVGGKLLLVRQGSGERGSGSWAVPGGRVEPGERLREAVEREVREETGLRVRCRDFVGWAERIGHGHHYVILDFRVEVLDSPGAAIPGDDADEVAWVPLAEVADHGLVPGLAEFLREHGVIPPRTR